MSRRRRRKLPVDPVEVTITDLSHDGRGVGRHGEKVIFVHGALPDERVMARVTETRRDQDAGRVESILEPAASRVEPRCPWFGYCGGCALQHMDHDEQLAFKAGRLRENLSRIGQVEPEKWLDPVTATPWNYRRRARLSVRLVHGKGRVLVGFRELAGRYVADIEHCQILHPDFAHRLLSLSELIGGLSIPDRIPQVETASGDGMSAIVLRHLEPLSPDDLMALGQWSREHGIAVYLQPKGPDTVHLLAPETFELSYRLPDFDLDLAFQPQHFIQVNAEVNQALVARALDLLEPGPDDRVLDLFCGLGNFSLPLARRAGQVTGVEGEPALVQAAGDNARRNGITNAVFATADLAAETPAIPGLREGFDSVLLDPPRSGAWEVLPLVHRSGARRLVYVSCNPATLARDAGRLTTEFGYSLTAAGVADMFPHTAHVESVAVFERS